MTSAHRDHSNHTVTEAPAGPPGSAQSTARTISPSPPPAAGGPPSPGRSTSAPVPLGVITAGVVLGLFGLATIAPGFLAPEDPQALNLEETFAAPSWSHWFGTDELGRDLFSRVIHGTGESLMIGLGAAAVSLTIAFLLAAGSALTGRRFATATNLTIEVLFAFPTLLLALVLIAALGPSALTLIVAVGVGTAPGYARIIRSHMLSARVSAYVEAATVLGHSRSRILVRHILPNSLAPLVGVFTMSIGQSIVWASSLAFLGLGVAPPASEWGALLDAGRAYLTEAGWLVVVPGLVIVVLALAATTLGSHLHQRFEKGLPHDH